jgi:hypothetical protein
MYSCSRWVGGDEERTLNWGLVECPHEFVPLGFEAGCAFGPATRDFSTGGGEDRGRTGVRGPLPLECNGVGEHWQQCPSLVLARGQASLVLGVVVVPPAWWRATNPRGLRDARRRWSSLRRTASHASSCEGRRVHHTPHRSNTTL